MGHIGSSWADTFRDLEQDPFHTAQSYRQVERRLGQHETYSVFFVSSLPTRRVTSISISPAKWDQTAIQLSEPLDL